MMNDSADQDCPDFETLSAYADGESVEDADRIERHLETCEACRSALAEIAAIDGALRREARDLPAPPRLTNWLDRRLAYRRARRMGGMLRPSRRHMLMGGAAAAAAAAAFLVMGRQGTMGGEMAPTIFQDFATRVAADKALDFRSDDFGVIAGWLDARLSFLTPRPPALERMALRGGRLCWLLDRRVAAIHFKHGAKETCFYVAESHGLTLTDDAPIPHDGAPPALLSGSGAAGAFWREGSLAYAVVGAAPLPELEALASMLRARV